MTAGSYVATLLKGLADAVTPAADTVSKPAALQALFASFGAAVDDATAVAASSALAPLAEHVTALTATAGDLDPATSDPVALVGQVAPVAAALGTVVADLRQLATRPPTLPAPLDTAAFWETFGEHLLGHLVYEHMAVYAPRAIAVLRAVGVAHAETVDETGAVVLTPSMLDWAAIATVLTEPSRLVRDTYGWGSALAHLKLVDNLAALANATGLGSSLMGLDEGVLAAFWGPRDATTTSPSDGLTRFSTATFPIVSVSGTGPAQQVTMLRLSVLPVPDPVAGAPAPLVTAVTGPASGLGVILDGDAGLALTIPLTRSFTLTVGGAFNAGAWVTVHPAGAAFFSGGAQANSNVTLTATGVPPAPWRVGDRDGIAVETSKLTLTTTMQAATQAGAQTRPPTVTVKADASLTVVLELGGGDSFITHLIGTGKYAAAFEAGAVWSSDHGLRLKGGISASGPTPLLHTQIPVDLDLAGILRVTAITLATAAVPDGGELRVLATGSLTLGPLTVTVDQLGAAARLTAPATGPTNLGPLHLQLGLSGPVGLGVAITNPLVGGGGYLSVDAENGRYTGAVSLKVGTLTVQGVGVLSTRLPGGGWSLIALAEVEGLAVQLGFGIQLSGIGVLVGIHRSMNVTGLQALARSGGLQGVLFPADLAANPARAAAQLDSLFPAAPGQYVLGPILELTWGPGPILTAQVAVYVEFPQPTRVAILGALRLVAPNPAAPVVDLHLDLLGLIDLSAKTVSLDMSLTRSTLAGMPLTGQAALRAGWGANATFVLAVGGFHPNYPAPAGFPTLQRVALNLGSGALSIRLSAYLAVTSNTVQLGAQIDLRAAAGPAALTATAGFDALIQFKPFHLEIDVFIHAAISLWGHALMALDITARLCGPGPWQVHGRVHFSVLFCSFTISISGSFGAALPPAAPATVDILGPLATAVADRANWVLTSPTSSACLVLRTGVAGTAIHPLAGLELHQRTVPLHIGIDRFGPDLVAHGPVLTLTCRIGPAATAATTISSIDQPVMDLFAPAQYLAMTEAQRLTAASFEAMPSGVRLALGSSVVATATGNSSSDASAAAITSTSGPLWSAYVVDPAPAAGAAPAPAASAAALTSMSAPGVPSVSTSPESSITLVAVDGYQLPASLVGLPAPAPLGPQTTAYSGPTSQVQTADAVYTTVSLDGLQQPLVKSATADGLSRPPTGGVPTFHTRVGAITSLGGGEGVGVSADIVIFLSERQLFPTLAQESAHA